MTEFECLFSVNYLCVRCSFEPRPVTVLTGRVSDIWKMRIPAFQQCEACGAVAVPVSTGISPRQGDAGTRRLAEFLFGAGWEMSDRQRSRERPVGLRSMTGEDENAPAEESDVGSFRDLGIAAGDEEMEP